MFAYAPIIPFGLQTVLVTDVCRGGDRLRAAIMNGVVLDYTGSGRTGLQLRLIMNYEFNLL